MAVTAENTIFEDEKNSRLSRIYCPSCHEETENCLVPKGDANYPKVRAQHASDCRLFLITCDCDLPLAACRAFDSFRDGPAARCGSCSHPMKCHPPENPVSSWGR